MGGRRCDVPNIVQLGVWGGAVNGAPEANAFRQQPIENWLKISSLGRRLTPLIPIRFKRRSLVVYGADGNIANHCHVPHID